MGFLNLFKKKSKQDDLSYLNNDLSTSLNDVSTDLNSSSTDISSLNKVVSKPSEDDLELSKGLPSLDDVNSSVGVDNSSGNLPKLDRDNDQSVSLKLDDTMKLNDSFVNQDSLNSTNHHYVDVNDNVSITKSCPVHDDDLKGDWNTSKIQGNFHLPDISNKTNLNDKNQVSVNGSHMNNKGVIDANINKFSVASTQDNFAGTSSFHDLHNGVDKSFNADIENNDANFSKSSTNNLNGTIDNSGYNNININTNSGYNDSNNVSGVATNVMNNNIGNSGNNNNNIGDDVSIKVNNDVVVNSNSSVKSDSLNSSKSRVSIADDLPSIDSIGSKYKHQMRDGEIFIQKHDYGKILMAVDGVNKDLSNSLDLLGNIDALRKTKDKRFNSFKSKLNDMNSYFLKIDNILFER